MLIPYYKEYWTVSPSPNTNDWKLPVGQTRVSLTDLLNMQQQLLPAGVLTQKGAKSFLLGLHQSRLRGRGMEFDQVRLYQSGDDIRTIDWRVTARTGEPHSKIFQEEREHPVFLVVEQSPAMFFASTGNFKSVQAAYMASLVAWAAQANHDRVGGLVFSASAFQHIRPQRHQRGTLRLLNVLAEANQALTQPQSNNGNQQQLLLALHYCSRQPRPGSLIVLICDERNLSDESEALLLALAKRFDLILVPVSDPMEQHLPPAGDLLFQEDRKFLRLNNSLINLNKSWQRRHWRRRQQWQRLAQHAGLALIPLSTSGSLLSQLTALQHTEG